MIHVYLDWNVFDRIEKTERLNAEEQEIYGSILELIIDNKIVCPYSNAHINDLIRGYKKNPAFLPGHLETISRLTLHLCIAQYWGNSGVTWHYRNPGEFFNAALEDEEMTATSFTGLMEGDGTGLWEMQLRLLRSIPVDKRFKEIYNADPIFNIMYPRTKTQLNMLAMCEDLYDFYLLAKKDFSVYKSLRKFVNQSRARLKAKENVFKELNAQMSAAPPYLENDEIWEKYAPKTKTSDNPAYQKVTDAYFMIDFRGYKSDERFSNMIDDALHVFYGAHCDYFITNDDKCHYKAGETYRKLGISTKVMKPDEFVNGFPIKH